MQAMLATSIELQVGVAFSPAQLTLLRGWSEFHELTMCMDLAEDMPGVPFDEAILLAGRNDSRMWLIWRTPEGVALKLPTGRTTSHASLADALCAAISPAADARTDIQPRGW